MQTKQIIILIITLLIFGSIASAIQSSVKKNSRPMPAKPNEPEQVFCTMEAKMCPDGSYVGRTGPKCEFAACPMSGPTSEE